MARKKNAHTSMKQYNPEKFMAEMSELAAQSPQDAAEVAATWRERFHNAMEEGAKTTQKALGISIAAATAFGMSFWDGTNEASAEDLVDEWMASPEAATAATESEVDLNTMSEYDREKFAFTHMDESDPRTIFGIDKVLVGTLLLAAAAVFNLAKDYTPFVESAALGSAAYWAGSIGFRIGKERKEDSLEADAADDAKQAA